MLKLKNSLCFFIVVFTLFASNVFSEDSEKVLYLQIVNTVKDVIDKKHDPIKGYNLLNNYISSNTDKSLADDLEVIKSAMLYEIKLYQAALDNLDMISDEYKIVSLENITLENVSFLPVKIVENDYTAYSSLLNAKSFLKLKNYTHAEIYIASIYKRIKDNVFYWESDPAFVFDVYMTYAQSFIFKQKPAMGSKILKEYENNSFNKSDIYKKKVSKYLLELINKRPSGRNPFVRSDIDINVVKKSKKVLKKKNHYYLTGIVSEDDKYVIIEINRQSYIRRRGYSFGGYQIVRIRNEHIVLQNIKTKKTIKLYVGQGKAL